jgi:glycosyltransferase involved in cell wall biosynthesis
MKNIKVCLLSSEFLPNWGGVGTYCIELARALADKIELHVVTLKREERGKFVYSKGDIESYFNKRIFVHLLTTCSASDTFFYNGKMQLAVSKKLPNLIDTYNFDLVHTNFPQMADILLKLRGKINVPSVTTIHTTIEGHRSGIVRACSFSGLGFSKLDRSEKSVLLCSPVLKLAERLYIKKSKNFITVSNWMKERVTKDFSSISKLHVIHNGVDLKKFSPENSKDPQILNEVSGPIILLTSRLTALKGTHLLIQAIPKILEKNKNAHFVFAGAGSKDPWIDELKKLKINASSYTFLGHVDYKLMPSLYSMADILVLPSLYENLPFGVLEAMSCELAVVASRVGGITEVITDGENGMLFSPGNVEELAKIIIMLLEDRKLRNRLGKNARQTMIKGFSWATIAENTLRVYKEVLGM